MEKQIKEMAKIIRNANGMSYPENYFIADAKILYRAGYRKIYDDHQRQCTCYSLGCQMADSIEKKVAGEFIEAVDKMMELVVAMTGCSFTYFGKYAELKKKYIGKDTNITTNTEEGK